MFAYALVLLGGAAGAGFRFHLSRVALANLGPGFPWATLIVNIVGGLLMGVLTVFLVREGAQGEPLRLFLGVGVLGGFTTFSAFSLELFEMLARDEFAMAAAYATASVAGSVAALFLGMLLVRVTT